MRQTKGCGCCPIPGLLLHLIPLDRIQSDVVLSCPAGGSILGRSIHCCWSSAVMGFLFLGFHSLPWRQSSSKRKTSTRKEIQLSTTFVFQGM